MPGFRRRPLPSALEFSCGLLFALAAHLVLSWIPVNGDLTEAEQCMFINWVKGGAK
ncbi:hypothetical protein [Nannocystis pusilla]|uniref:hypothetical protein n=1 Tax=Nannocystis pusilla TaxID=889268 RepID=UPI003BF3DD9A